MRSGIHSFVDSRFRGNDPFDNRCPVQKLLCEIGTMNLLLLRRGLLRLGLCAGRLDGGHVAEVAAANLDDDEALDGVAVLTDRHGSGDALEVFRARQGCTDLGAFRGLGPLDRIGQQRTVHAINLLASVERKSPLLPKTVEALSDAVAEQRDVLDFGISQRFQTKRGPADRRRTVDWLEWNLDFVWVGDSSERVAGPDRLLWNEPFIPLVNRDGRVIPPLDRRTTDLFGPRQNYASTEVVLRMTDTTSILGDLYYDMQKGIVEQLDLGFSRLCWPNLTYYVGSRYLRNVDNTLGEQGSTALTFAATYILDPRYTVVLAEQFDFDYGVNVRTDATLIRKYHRTNLALTFSVDESVDEQRVVLSLWPEGVPELAIGVRRYMDLGASDVYQ